MAFGDAMAMSEEAVTVVHVEPPSDVFFTSPVPPTIQPTEELEKATPVRSTWYR
jgi:hypothetical protein